jgi:hypothetical protein
LTGAFVKICLVGETGNISSSIVRKLLEPGHELTLYNRGNRMKFLPGCATSKAIAGSASPLMPKFQTKINLELGMSEVLEILLSDHRVPNSDDIE